MRPIDADELWDGIKDALEHNDITCNSDVLAAIDASPTIDMAPVERGRWVRTQKFYRATRWKCSVCEAEWAFVKLDPIKSSFYYCPNCGALMLSADGVQDPTAQKEGY